MSARPRSTARLNSVEAYVAKLTQLGLALDGGPARLAVASNQFVAEAVILLDDIPFRYYSRIERELRGHRVSARSRGVY